MVSSSSIIPSDICNIFLPSKNPYIFPHALPGIGNKFTPKGLAEQNAIWASKKDDAITPKIRLRLYQDYWTEKRIPFKRCVHFKWDAVQFRKLFMKCEIIKCGEFLVQWYKSSKIKLLLKLQEHNLFTKMENYYHDE